METKYELLRLLEAKYQAQCKESLLRFTQATMPTFVPADYHRRYYRILTQFARGEIKKLMVFLPPQHGKSEGSTRRLPAFLLGNDPNLRIAVVSYNAPKARKFNREIQRIIDMPEYHAIFPDTILAGSNGVPMGAWARSSDEFEIVGHTGSCKTVGVGGPLTGDPVDVLIMDDLYKDAKTAWSPTVRESVSDWYDTVAETRLHNQSRQLIVFTRWHQDDLAGTLIRQQGVFSDENPTGWQIIIYPAIKEGTPTEYDPRQEGEALWPERHSLQKLQEIRDRNPHVFESLYQQNPKPLEGLLYESGFRTYETLPITRRQVVKNYTDTADEGKDYHCSIDYVETEIGNFVLDVLYTQKPMEYTEQQQARMMTKDKVRYCNIESNNGGRGFARNVERNLRLMNNNRTHVHWFHQGDNKMVRIFTRSSEVQNLIFFPEGWQRLWPEFHNAIVNYMKVGTNAHDDAPDCLTGTVEMRSRSNGGSASDYFPM